MSAWELHAQQEMYKLLTQIKTKNQAMQLGGCAGYIKTDDQTRSKPKRPIKGNKEEEKKV
jgi:hypothetical protein